MEIDSLPDAQSTVRDAIVLARLEGLEGHARAAEHRILTEKTTSQSKASVLTHLKPSLINLPIYSPIAPLEERAEELGLDLDELVKLDANENLYGPPPEVLEVIVKANHHIYPDPSQLKLRTALANSLGVHFDRIVCGLGADDLIDLICRIVKPNPIIISSPCFAMYSYSAGVAGLPVIDVPRKPETFDLDEEAIKVGIKKHQASILFITNPNNPTGHIVSNDVIASFCEENCLVVVDEAYTEFTDQNCQELIHKYDNLIILRTFSKWAGLAGLRVGYCIAHQDITRVLLSIKQPYNVNIAADFAARICLEKKSVIFETVKQIRLERERLMKELQKFNFIKPLPSHANFILMKIVDGKSAHQLASDLRSLGVLLRYYSSSELKDYIRVSVARPQDTDKFLWALNMVSSSKLLSSLNGFKPEGVLLDMDGVLVNVSLSYRQAIIDTCKSFGVTVTMQDIDNKKAQSGFNNDWVLSQSLLKDKGVEVLFEKCKDKFEELYQGTETVLGLWHKETLIPNRSLLKFLKSKGPVAIVTGRPKLDASQFIRQHKIAEFFDYVICDEDTVNHKPDPEPVIKALELLQINKAIMVGDTPDDIRAAIRVPAEKGKVIGIGILAPNKAGDEEMRKSLLSAGASCVISDLQELRLLFN
eukprot:TRINITY_DN2101_c0_g1_i3.p1 TRINITY_DN2101_c0_g1~~TRINITY_DN2101_c0_g1_i3.p1  ORF type:complete len:647 (+),score=120.59 TRINITY_DN2101_c0_g1_i3:1248-3188(+)